MQSYTRSKKSLVVKIGSPSQSQRNGILAAVTGSPVVTVPIGFSDPTPEAPIGVPIGMEILGRQWSEKELLQIARQLEKLSSYCERRPPTIAEQIIETQPIARVPSILPDSSNMSQLYPLGKLCP